MNPSPPEPKPTPHPRVVIVDHSWRNTFIAVGIGIVLLIFCGYGVMHMGSPVKGNKLSGKVIEKVFIPQKEQQIRFSGKKIEGVKEIDGEYILKVRVEAENRTYEVPVEHYTYQTKKVGDSLTFIRPQSEQK